MTARATLQPASQGGLREEIETQVKEAIRGAQDAASEASAQSGGRQVIVLPNGKKLIVNGNDVRFDGEALRALEGSPPPIPFDPNTVPDGVVDIVQALGATLVLCVVGFPIARAFARWLDRRGTAPSLPTEVLTRLNSIEHAVETVAVEVERISEGQRFTTKLLNDRATREIADPVSAGAGARG